MENRHRTSLPTRHPTPLPQTLHPHQLATPAHLPQHRTPKNPPPTQHKKRFVDTLAQVTLHNNQSQYLYIHTEAQAQHDPQLALRMFVSYCCLFDRLQHAPLTSLAILADPNPSWPPQASTRAVAGWEMAFRFPTVKLLDLEETGLEQSANPFALVGLAHLRALKVRGHPELLFAEKVGLVRALGRRGDTMEDFV